MMQVFIISGIRKGETDRHILNVCSSVERADEIVTSYTDGSFAYDRIRMEVWGVEE